MPDTTFVEEAADPSDDPAGIFDYSVLAKAGHPRLLMDEVDFALLKIKVTGGRASNEILSSIHQIIMEQADKCASDTIAVTYTFDESHKRILHQSFLANYRLITCAYAYRLTGDAKYLQRAVSDLRAVCSFPDWNPSHFLDVGEMSFGVAIAYDWLYYDLSYDDRVMVHQALVDKAIRPSTGASFHHTVGNWNAWCNLGIIASAVALYDKDKELCAGVIETGAADNKRITGLVYSPDGNYGEGYGYWDGGTLFEVALISILDKAFGSCNGIKDVPGFMDTANYFLYMTGPAGRTFSYADGGASKESPSLAMWWFAAQQNDPTLLYNEIRMLKTGRYDSLKRLTLLPCFIKNINLDEAQIQPPAGNIWCGRGEQPVLMVRSGWEDDSSDQYLCFKGGNAYPSHGHMDAGSFLYDSKGVCWAEDLYRPPYTDMENALWAAGGEFWNMGQKSLRWDVFRMNNLCHSTISFEDSDGSVDKLHPSDQLVHGKATLEEVYETEEALGGMMDLSATYADQVAAARRSVRLIDKSYVEIKDVVTAKDDMDARVQWRMVTGASVSVDADGETLSKDGEALRLEASSDVPLKYAIWPAVRPSSWTPRAWDSSNDGYVIAGFTATVPAGSTVTFTTILK